MFDWSMITSTTAVHCITDEEIEAFLEECEKHGIKWCTGASALELRKLSSPQYFYPFEKGGMARDDEGSLCAGYTVIEYSELRVPDLPHICSVLCPENPLKIGEHFKIQGYVPEFWIDKFEHLAFDSEDFAPFALAALSEAINHPEKIIRRPQFSEDEKALMRLCGDNGYWQWYRLSSGQLHAKEYDEMFGPEINCVCMKEITEKYTREHPFDAAAYLESEESK